MELSDGKCATEFGGWLLGEDGSTGVMLFDRLSDCQVEFTVRSLCRGYQTGVTLINDEGECCGGDDLEQFSSAPEAYRAIRDMAAQYLARLQAGVPVERIADVDTKREQNPWPAACSEQARSETPGDAEVIHAD